MPAVPSFAYEVTNSNSFEVALNVAGSHLRLAPGQVYVLGTNNDSDDFPMIPGVTVVKSPYPILVGVGGVAYIPSGCEVEIQDPVDGIVGDGVQTQFTFQTSIPVDPGSLVFLNHSEGFLADDGQGNVIPTIAFSASIVSGSIDYNTGEINIEFVSPPDNLSTFIIYVCHRHSLYRH